MLSARVWPTRTPDACVCPERSPPIDIVFLALVGLRWVHFASMAVLFGGASFWLAAARPADWPAAARGTARLAPAAAVLAALSGIGWELATVADMGGDPASALDPALLHAVVFDSPFGPVLIARLVLLALLLAIVVAPVCGRLRLASTAVVAGLVLASQAWLGHAATGGTSPRGIAMLLAYVGHILAVGAWVGGLPPLLLVLREARATDAGQGRPILALLRRVSSLATVAVVLLVAAGTANATFRLNSPADLIATGYGRVLLVKLALTGVMLGLAAGNRRIARRARTAGMGSSVACELALGILVLGAAALLGVTPPPR